jgi:hypothetical protein
MPVEPAVERLLGLGLVIAVAAAAVALALRLNRRRAAEHEGIVLGYPPELYPTGVAASAPALGALAAVQARLTAVDRQLAAADPGMTVGDLALWLRVFLLELRRLMDAAYRAAVITDAYGGADRLDRLAVEVRTIEAQVIDDITGRLLGEAGAGRPDRLNRRLAALRDCARELAEVTAPPTGAGDAAG